MAQKKVLVTGAAGFIGMHCALALKNRGDEVIGVDNFNAYYDPRIKRQRERKLSEAGIEITEGDITNFALLDRIVQWDGITHILHLAAQAGVRYSLDNPHAYLKANIDGFLSVLEIVRKRPHIPLVYASSSSVYGTNTKLPFAIGDQTDSPANLYGATKKANEVMAYSYHSLFGIHATGLRFFTVYGPWGRPDMAYWLFAKAIRHNQPISLFNEGKMQRDFTYIDDVVAGTLAALDQAAGYRLYNLGNNRSEELGTLVQLLEKQLGPAQKKLLPMQAGDIPSTFADISESQKDLGFAPTTSLETGIQRFAEWYRGFAD